MPGQRTALTLLILIEAAAFAYMSETVLFPAAIAAAAVIGSRGLRLYRASQDRQVILSLIAALVFVVKWRVQPHSHIDETMEYLSPFLHSLGQFLLVLQTAALYLVHDRNVLPVTLPWPGVFVMVSAGDVNVLAPQRFAFQIFAVAFIAATAFYFAATARASAGLERRPSGAGKLLLSVVLLLLTAAISWAASFGLHRYEHTLDRLVAEMLDPEAASSGAGFPSRSRLGSIAQRKSERAGDLALRVYSSAEPGYLRGKAYHWLRSVRGADGLTTQWEEAPEPSVGHAEPPRETLRPAARSRNRFTYSLDGRSAPSSATTELDVWLESSQDVYFLPPLAAELVTSEGQLRRDCRYVASGTDAGILNYRVRTGRPPDPAPDFDLSSDDGPFSRAALTHVPGSTLAHPIVHATADQIFHGKTTFAEHVAAVEQHFRSNYGYTIGIDVPHEKDPVIWFLEWRPKAHCEFFAQAAALLLRTRGIPTRYMTGFVVAERNEYGGYWLARNEHAHAWCEAWDDRLGWVVVEATPPVGVPSESLAPFHRQLWEYLSGRIAEFRYRFAEGGWTWLLNRVAAFVATPAGASVLLLAVGYVAFRLRMRRDTSHARSVPPAIAGMHRLLARMDRRLAKAGVTRRRSETLTRFAARVESEAADPAAAAWYADYAAARYGPTPDDATLAALASRLRTLGPPPSRPREPAPT